MKKIMIMVLAAIATMTASAQNPDALKQIKGAKTYADANAIIAAQAASMTNAEKAQAYNKLVDLALSEYTKSQEKAVKAQLAKDEATQTAETTNMYESVYNAMQAAQDCNVADQQPNDKGKVAPKFKEKNASRLLAPRNEMINAGLACYNSKDYAKAQKYFGMFVESRQSDLFNGTDFSKEVNYGQVSYYAGLAAYFNKDYKKVDEYAGIAVKSGDKEIANDVITLKMGALEGQVQNHQMDTAQYINKVKELFEVAPENEAVFGKLVGLYDESGDKANADAILNARLQQNPNDAMALAYKGQNAQSASKWDEAIEAYSKAIQSKPDFLAAKTNLAVCYLNKSTELYDSSADARGNVKPEIKAQVIEGLNKSKSLLDELAAADPDQLQVKWKYQVDRVNYALEIVNK